MRVELKREWILLNGAIEIPKENPRSLFGRKGLERPRPQKAAEVTVAAGVYEVECIPNPYGHRAPWLVLKGTKIGMAEGAWRQWCGSKSGDREILFYEDDHPVVRVLFGVVVEDESGHRYVYDLMARLVEEGGFEMTLPSETAVRFIREFPLTSVHRQSFWARELGEDKGFVRVRVERIEEH